MKCQFRFFLFFSRPPIPKVNGIVQSKQTKTESGVHGASKPVINMTNGASNQKKNKKVCKIIK